tara:strand:+ start:38 stop:1066 length:1029 start_codon:yes stop_codon:yes gene_type:complete
MAINTAAFSPKEFQVAIAEQDAFGTIEANGGNAYHALDVDSIGFPSLNPTQVLDVRTGSRVLQKEDFFQDVKASVKEISLSGTATTNALDMLLENITGKAEGAGTDGVYSFASNAGVQSVGKDDSSQAGTLLSLIMFSPLSNSDLAFKDCVVTSLTLNGDVGTEGGRIKFSATFQTGTLAEDLSDENLTNGIDIAFGANENYFMSGWSDVAYRKIYGVDDLVMSSFSLTLENPATFTGLVSTGYEVVSRAGEFSATLDVTAKYDVNTEPLIASFNNQTQQVAIAAQATLLNDDGTMTNGKFGISMPTTVLTNVAFNEGDIMMLDISVKAVGDGSSSLVEVSC